ncbi:MAG: branched-chain amino acid transport system II carrier protein [Bacteroidota bacterium]
MKKNSLLYGFSVFAMFFGSGNLVYPIQVGLHTLQNWHWGYVGFFCTGILLPFLGCYVIMLHGGNYFQFFGEAGKVAEAGIPLVALSLIGSFGIIPRCITVAYGGMAALFPACPLWLFSLLFCMACFFLCWEEKWMFQILGNLLTPLLLFLIVLLLIFGLCHQKESLAREVVPLGTSLQVGFTEGYNTMDLIGAFFITALVAKEIGLTSPDLDQKGKIRYVMTATAVGITLLACVYFGLVYLGATYGSWVNFSSPERILPNIAQGVLGVWGATVIAMIVLLSCLTTAVAMNKMYSEYLATILPTGTIHYPIVLLIVTLVAYFISCFNFVGIARFLTPILQVCYPALIVLAILSTALKQRKLFKAIIFYGIVILCTVWQVYQKWC